MKTLLLKSHLILFAFLCSLSGFAYVGDNTITPASININLGTHTTETGWNNVSPSSKFVEDLKDTQGVSSEISVTLDDDFSGTNMEGVQTTTTALNMPQSVSSSAIWGYSQGTFGGDPRQETGGFSFSHLNKELVYDFYIFGSRKNVSDNRETQYVLNGENRKRAYLNASGNGTELAVISGIKPDAAGNITLAVSPGPNNTNGNKFYYINAMQVVAREYREGDFDDNEPKGREIKILAIGNSFSEDAVEQYLYEMALEGGDNLIIGNAYRGGQGLESHWNVAKDNKPDYEYRKVVDGRRTVSNSKTLLHCLTDEDWDYITFQQVSQDSGIESKYEPWLTYLLGYVKQHVTNPDVKYALHRTWAYSRDSGHDGFKNYGKNQMKMFQAIVDAVNNVAAGNSDISFIIPAGTAVQNARTSFIGDNFCRDGYHLNDMGRYAAACTWLEKITGQSPVGKEYVPASVSPVAALIGQHAAHLAIENPDVVSKLDFGYPPVNPIRPDTININFGNPTTSPLWNNLSSTNKFIYDLQDIKENSSEILMLLDNDFSGINTEGVQVTTTQLNMPQEVSTTATWGYSQGSFGGGSLQATGGFSFSHLNKDLRYDFYIFASRKGVNDNREAQYVFQGKNRKRDYLDAANNSTELAVIRGIQPDKDGVIKLTVSPTGNNTNSNKFYYINAMQVVGRDYIAGDDDDNEIDPVIEIAEGQKYNIKHAETGLYLRKMPDTSSDYKGDFCLFPFIANDKTFEYNFVSVSDDEAVYTIGIDGQYINAGEGGTCVWGTGTEEHKAYIKIEAESNEIFAMRALWSEEPNYISTATKTAKAYISTDKETGARWKLEEVEPGTGLEESLSKGTLVYPSITNGIVTVVTHGHSTVTVSDITGKILNAYESQGYLGIHMNYSNGMYLITVDSGEKQTYKVLLNR